MGLTVLGQQQLVANIKSRGWLRLGTVASWELLVGSPSRRRPRIPETMAVEVHMHPKGVEVDSVEADKDMLMI